jgi:hypothetical protein
MDLYEATGSVGRIGTPAGDVGFIHSVRDENNFLSFLCSVKRKDRNNGGEGHYFGFDDDVKLEYKETDDKKNLTKDNIPYVKFMNPNETSKKASYAYISSAGNDNFPRDMTHSRLENEAVKMKAIIRQNLVQHLTEIDERKQMARSLKAAISDSMGQQSDYIEKLIQQIDQKQAQLHLSSCQRSQQREEFRQSYVRPSARKTKVQNSLNSFTTPVGKTGRRPVDLGSLCQQTNPQLYFEKSIKTCPDLLPTANGNDSALHSILGRMNSAGLYVCADTNKFRQQIANSFQNKENEAKSIQSNQIEAVEKFVLRQNDDEAFPFASAKKKEFLTCRQQNGGESQFDWLQTPELSEEYVSFIRSPLSELDLPEVGFLAKVLDITIHVYEDQDNSSSFKHTKTFDPNYLYSGKKGKKQHFILYKGGGECKD